MKKINKVIEVEQKDYHLEIKMNDTVFATTTNDLRDAIVSNAPKVLKTKVLFTIKNKEGKTCERQFFVNRGKMIFRNQIFMTAFLKNLIYK